MSFDFGKNIKISNLFYSGISKAEIARRLKCSIGKVYQALKDVSNGKFERKKYDSESRYLINSNQGNLIIEYVVFNKFTTLDQIINCCDLACSKQTLSRFLRREGIIQNSINFYFKFRIGNIN